MSNNSKMEVDYVTKRDGSKEEMSFEKVAKRIKILATWGSTLNINPTKLSQKVCSQIYPDIPTTEIDELAAQICASLATEHPDWVTLASRIIISNNHRNSN